jgi:ribose transport system permease protein
MKIYLIKKLLNIPIIKYLQFTKNKIREYGIVIAFIFELFIFSIISEHFLSSTNLINVTLQTSIIAIIAVGMTFVILTAGIDLSVGSMVALSGIICALILKLSLPVWMVIVLGVCAALVLGMISGLLSGIFISRFNITPFITTLAMMTIWRGLAYMIVGGRPIWGLPKAFDFLGSGRIGQIPFPSIFMILIYVIAWFVLSHTPFGRSVYAVGGNSEAARLAGIKTSSVLIRVYMICGLLAALSGILLSSRMSSGQPNAGLMYELEVIAAVVVGGTSLFGGRGTVIGTFFGAMLIGVLRNGLNLVGVGSYFQQIVLGLVILLAVLIDQFQKKDRI